MYIGMNLLALLYVFLTATKPIRTVTNYDELLSWKPVSQQFPDIPELRMKQFQDHAILLKESLENTGNHTIFVVLILA